MYFQTNSYMKTCSCTQDEKARCNLVSHLHFYVFDHLNNNKKNPTKKNNPRK